MFWSIFINSLVLIVAILIVGWILDTAVRKLGNNNSDNL